MLEWQGELSTDWALAPAQPILVHLPESMEAAMRKEQIAAVLWTLGLAIPFAALALFGVAYLTDHLVQIVNGLASIEWR
jgi:hypothetical protein